MSDFFADKLLKSQRIEKTWGHEEIIVNDEKNNYCGKLLNFNAGARFSMHSHDQKRETFLVARGKIKVWLIDTRDASLHEKVLSQGEILKIDRLLPHEVLALEDSQIIEFSTFHRDEDSFRYWRKS
jgi:quercetin dioxygenase-like cupin family protein